MTAPSSKKKKPVYVVLVIVLAVVAFLVIWGQLQSRLSVGAAFGGAGFEKRPERTHYSTYDIEPQVIYRLDDNRYVELSNYDGCQGTSKDQQVVEVWYYDVNLGIKTEIPSGVRNYQGRIINADPSGKNLIFPVSDSKLGCSERGCGGSTVFYSTDYGRTLKHLSFTSRTSYDPSGDSKEFTVMITGKELIAYKRDSFIKITLDEKYINGEPVRSYGSVKNIPSYPVLMEHYQCDASIKPKSIGSITVKEYDEMHRPYFEQLLSTVNKTISALDEVVSWLVKLRTHYAVYDVAPQVIYQLDDSRYVELSNYGGCLPTYEDEKVVEVWYHDLNRNIKTRLFSKMRNYRGKIINADPSGKNLAFSVTPDRTTCAEELCGESMVYYSTDYGETFKPFYFLIYRDGRDEARDPIKYSKEYTTVITGNELTVYKKYGRIYKFKKIMLNNETLEKDYGSADAIPSYPVLMDHYQCDVNIKPKHVSSISVKEYNRQKKGN